MLYKFLQENKLWSGYNTLNLRNPFIKWKDLSKMVRAFSLQKLSDFNKINKLKGVL